MQTVTKTIYPESGKVVFESEGIGIMISTELYYELSGFTNEEIFQELRQV